MLDRVNKKDNIPTITIRTASLKKGPSTFCCALIQRISHFESFDLCVRANKWKMWRVQTFTKMMQNVFHDTSNAEEGTQTFAHGAYIMAVLVSRQHSTTNTFVVIRRSHLINVRFVMTSHSLKKLSCLSCCQ